MKTILVLFGGCSTEYEVSLQSVHAVLQALDTDRSDQPFFNTIPRVL